MEACGFRSPVKSQVFEEIARSQFWRDWPLAAFQFSDWGEQSTRGIVMKKGKNYYYRVNPESVLSELTSIPHEEWLPYFLGFFHDLRSDCHETAKTTLAATIIKEAHSFREKRANAGKVSAEQRATQGQQTSTHVEHMLGICATQGQQTSTSSSSSSSSSTEKKKKKTKPAGAIKPEMLEICKAWKAYVEMRIHIGKKMTDYAMKLRVNDLEKLQAQGHNPIAVLNQSTASNWQDLYPIKAVDMASTSPSSNKFEGWTAKEIFDYKSARGIS